MPLMMIKSSHLSADLKDIEKFSDDREEHHFSTLLFYFPWDSEDYLATVITIPPAVDIHKNIDVTIVTTLTNFGVNLRNVLSEKSQLLFENV